ncbi:hypothetical protein DOY81_008707, partial [Sarcophaga bullata]
DMMCVLKLSYLKKATLATSALCLRIRSVNYRWLCNCVVYNKRDDEWWI